MIYNGINAGYGGFGMGGNQGDAVPAAYLNYILFDKNYKVLNMGWRPVTTASSWAKAKLSFDPINIKEAGYIFVYLSYENQSNNWVHFDDLKVTHTKSRIVQYNEYYPFGLQTTNSWTRENTTGNNFLANGGTELNQTSQLYDLDFRNYDPILGRMNGVDPMASKYSSLTPYNYSFNNPVTFTDPNGADPYDHYSGGSGYYYSGGYYTYDDVARNPDNMGEFHSAFGWRDSYSMGFMASATGYGRMSSSFGGMALPYNAQIRQDARAMRNGQMSLDGYGARHGVSMGSGLGGLTNAMLYLGAAQYDGGTFTYEFGGKTYGGTYHTENGAVTSTATALVIQSSSGGWEQIGAMRVFEFEVGKTKNNNFVQVEPGISGELRGRLTYGAQASIAFFPEPVIVPYIRGAFGIDINIGSIILWEGKGGTSNGVATKTYQDNAFIQSIGVSTLIGGFEMERIATPHGIGDSWSITSSAPLGIIVTQLNSDGNLSIGMQPRFKFATGFGAELIFQYNFINFKLW